MSNFELSPTVTDSQIVEITRDEKYNLWQVSCFWSKDVQESIVRACSDKKKHPITLISAGCFTDSFAGANEEVVWWFSQP